LIKLVSIVEQGNIWGLIIWFFTGRLPLLPTNQRVKILIGIVTSVSVYVIKCANFEGEMMFIE